MTRTNYSPDSLARELISMPSRRAVALLVGSGMALLTVTLLAAPLGAAHGAGVALAPAHGVQQADAVGSGTRQPVPLEFTDRLLPDPGTSWSRGRWTWRVPAKEWAVGVAIGFAVATWLLLNLLATVRRPTLIEPAASRRWLDGSAFGGLRMAWTLAKDPLVLMYLVAAAALAGAVYSGSFGLLSRALEERMAGPLSWAPTGALGFLGLLFGGGVKRRMSRWKVDAHDADALMSMLEEKSTSFLEVVRVHVEDEFHQGVSDLATVHEVGLIQRAMWTVSCQAVDQGRLQPAKREELMAGLLEIQPGHDDRSLFLNRRAAVDCATRLVSIEELDARLGEEERRRHSERRKSTKGPEGAERRTGSDRRVRSLWRPAGHLEFHPAL